MHYREAAANLLTGTNLDPYAGIPEFKVTAVRIEPVRRRYAAEERGARGARTLVAGDD
jgi:predicted molibdopterin-dependent oxidoreductase YjgC